VLRGFDDSVPGAASLGSQLLDLNDQNDRVADENADQRENAENGDEAELRTAGQQGRDDADMRQLRHHENQKQSRQCLRHAEGGGGRPMLKALGRKHVTDACHARTRLLGRAEPSLMHGARTMGKYIEAFLAFDVAKKKHAVGIAEGSWKAEVRFLGDVETARCQPSERSSGWRVATSVCTSALKPSRRGTGSIARSRRFDTIACRSSSDSETGGRARQDETMGCGHTGAASSGRRADECQGARL
jgi:hypothetical protein